MSVKLSVTVYAAVSVVVFLVPACVSWLSRRTSNLNISVIAPANYVYNSKERMDVFVFLNQSLNLTCATKNASFPPSHFEFRSSTLNNWTTQDTAGRLNLHKPITRLEQQGQYYCNSYETTTARSLPAAYHVRVDHPLQEVREVDCVVYDWTSMTCNFSLGINYRDDNINIRTELLYSTGSNDIRQKCPNYNKTALTCSWKTVDTNDNYTLEVRVTYMYSNPDMVNDTKRTTFEIHTARKVKPAPVTGLTAQTLNSTCIRLTWTDRKTGRKLTFINQTARGRSTVLHQTQNLTSADICQLHPFTNYSFEVWLEPLEGGLPSDIAVANAATEALPSPAPSVTPGSYWATSCQEQASRNVTIYWKRNTSMVYGIFQSHQVTVRSISLSNDTVFPLNESTIDVPIVTVQLECEQEYEVRMRVETNVGSSPSSEPLLIGRVSEVPKSPSGITVYSRTVEEQTRMYIRWFHPGEVDNFTVFYCPGSMASKTCKDGDLTWQTLPGTKHSVNLTLHDVTSGSTDVMDGDLTWQTPPETEHSVNLTLHDVTSTDVMGNYIAGISAQTGNISSGIAWSHCIYTADQVPSPVDSVTATEMHRGSLVVRWAGRSCRDEPRVYVHRYIIRYCLWDTDTNSSCKGEKSVFEDKVDGGRDSYQIRDVEEFATYRVSVQAESFDNTSSESYVYATTSGVLIPWAIGIIAVFSVFVASLAFFGVFVFCRHMKRKLQPTPIDISLPPEWTGTKCTYYSNSAMSADVPDPILNGQDQWSSDGSLEETSITESEQISSSEESEMARSTAPIDHQNTGIGKQTTGFGTDDGAASEMPEQDTSERNLSTVTLPSVRSGATSEHQTDEFKGGSPTKEAGKEGPHAPKDYSKLTQTGKSESMNTIPQDSGYLPHISVAGQQISDRCNVNSQPTSDRGSADTSDAGRQLQLTVSKAVAAGEYLHIAPITRIDESDSCPQVASTNKGKSVDVPQFVLSKGDDSNKSLQPLSTKSDDADDAYVPHVSYVEGSSRTQVQPAASDRKDLSRDLNKYCFDQRECNTKQKLAESSAVNGYVKVNGY